MTRTLWVTGASGFVGGHVRAMADELARDFGLVACFASDALQLLDPASIRRELAAVMPDVVLHLAAQSNVPQAFADPTKTLGINIVGTQHLIDALRAMPRVPRLVYVSSGDVYGLVSEADLPIRENLVPQPRNPYAVSKRSSEMLCRQWHLSHGLDVVIARPFNHIGPGQAEGFAISGFARQIALIKLGLSPPSLCVGNLEVTRDFTDVRDVVRGYATLANQGVSGGVYNICSGVETRVRAALDTLVELADVPVTVEIDSARLRPNEQSRAVGDSTAIRALGWQPHHDLRESLDDVLRDWLGRMQV